MMEIQEVEMVVQVYVKKSDDEEEIHLQLSVEMVFLMLEKYVMMEQKIEGRVFVPHLVP
jgi:hypothetical protein